MESENNASCEIFNRIENEFDEINQIVCHVEIMSDHKLYSHYLTKMKKLEVIAQKNKQYKKLLEDINDLKALNSGEIDAEIAELNETAERLLNEMKQIYRDGIAKENEQVVLEINSKEDDEFVALLSEIFEKYSNSNNYFFECLEKKDGSAKLKIKGEGVYKNLACFSGKIKKIYHGVESHAIVVILKTEEENFELNEDDLVIQTSKSSGAGGQHINKTESAVKIIHKPTGIFAECQNERSQLKNKERAMEILRKKITQKLAEKSEKDIKNQRKEQNNVIFGSAPTVIFDFDLNKFTLNKEKLDCKLNKILDGDLDLIINNKL